MNLGIVFLQMIQFTSIIEVEIDFGPEDDVGSNNATIL